VLGDDVLTHARAWADWPDVSAYDAWGDRLAQFARRRIVFRDVPRAEVVSRAGYDAFIHDTGIIPTRSRSWHDFFNAGIWSRFARAKLAITAAQLSERALRPGPQRTRRQDWLTHFDECGVVVASERPELLERIAALAWHELFVERRAELVQHVHFYCFGHAILEALREPYVGLMGKALLWHDPLASRAPGETALTRADDWLEAQLTAPRLPRLHALPVLGLPGWHAANEQRSFYDRPSYFRVLCQSASPT
jgi:hypothetical protein